MMETKVYSVLFICTGNSARSIIAEGLLNHLGRGRFKAYSAGSHPKGSVNPRALEVLQSHHISTEGFHSKGWETFSGPQAPSLDFVFTVCDQAAGEICPVWPGQPMTAHWGVEDPAHEVGTPEQIGRRYWDAMIVLRRRIELFLSLPMEKLDRLSLQKEVEQIGRVGSEATA
jgi:protein-tyrosine-phosphatase